MTVKVIEAVDVFVQREPDGRIVFGMTLPGGASVVVRRLRAVDAVWFGHDTAALALPEALPTGRKGER